MSTVYFTLDKNGKPLSATCDEYTEWQKRQNSTYGCVAQDEFVFDDERETVYVCTNFYPTHNEEAQRNIENKNLFETKVLGEAIEWHSEYCGTWREAEKQHNTIVRKLKNNTLKLNIYPTNK